MLHADWLIDLSRRPLGGSTFSRRTADLAKHDKCKISVYEFKLFDCVLLRQEQLAVTWRTTGTRHYTSISCTTRVICIKQRNTLRLHNVNIASHKVTDLTARSVRT